MDDAASRFRDKYILKTTSYNVPERTRRWYVRHVEVFIKAQFGRRLTTLTADDMERYLKEKGRSEKLADWWAGWKAGARELPADHATIASHKQALFRHCLLIAGSDWGRLLMNCYACSLFCL